MDPDSNPDRFREDTGPRRWSARWWFARFAFWSVNRDRGCAGGGVVSDCSGIAQADWAFTTISAGF